MRAGHLALLLAFLLLPEAANAEEEVVDPDTGDADDFDEDLDLDDVTENAAEAGPQFDESMPLEQRKARMGVCVSYTMARLQMRRKDFDEAVNQLITMNEMSKDQAGNTLIFSWVISCYANIGESELAEGLRGTTLTQEKEGSIFSKSEHFKPSQEHWQLASDALVAENKRMMERAQQQGQFKEQQQPGGQQGASNNGEPVPPTKSSFLYVVCAFGVIFGLVGLGILRLMKMEQNSKNKGSKKAEKKAGKKSH